MKIAIMIIVSLCCNVVTAQYDVIAFQDQYEEIEEFKSIALETFGDLYWEKEFELPYMFPYFDYNFEIIKCDVEGTCRFVDDIDFSLRLMTFGYMFDNVLDPNNIQSDVRYKYDEKDGKNYLVIQFTKNRLFSDTSIEEYDSHVNFQYWFFDDGTIELKFGPSNLGNSPVYVPSEGFYLLTDQGPIPAGPQLALYHPYDENIRLEYNDLDSYDEYELNTDGTGSVDWWPPDGWVIRFSNQLVSTKDQSSLLGVNVFPNPSAETITIEGDIKIDQVEIITIQGTNAINIINPISKTINVSKLYNGIYIIRILSNNSIITKKLIKL